MTTALWNESHVASAGPHLHFLIDLQPLWVFCMEEQWGRASGRQHGSASFKMAPQTFTPLWKYVILTEGISFLEHAAPLHQQLCRDFICFRICTIYLK